MMASKMTAKQQLRQLLKEERAGISVTAETIKSKGGATIALSVPRKTAVDASGGGAVDWATAAGHAEEDDEDGRLPLVVSPASSFPV